MLGAQRLHSQAYPGTYALVWWQYARREQFIPCARAVLSAGHTLPWGHSPLGCLNVWLQETLDSKAQLYISE